MSTPPSAQSPPPSKPRKKRSADVVSFDDLLAAHKTERGPGQLPAEGVVLIGVDIELQRRMAERLPLSGRLDDIRSEQFGTPFFSAPNLSTAASAVATTSVSDISAPNDGAPPDSAPNYGAYTPDRNKPKPQPYVDAYATEDPPTAPEVESADRVFDAASEFNVRDLLIRRTATKTYTVHSVSRIEDVFTSAERDLLRWLWEKGRPVPAIQRLRLVSGPNGEGARRLATQAGLIYNTFKNLTRSLSTKLALDIVKPEKNLPTIYAIYHYSAILERQRLAGFGGAVHKNGGGRDLVNGEAQPAQRRSDLTIEELEQLLGALKSSAPSLGTRALNFEALSGSFSAPNFATPIRNKEYTSGKKNTSTPSTPNPGAPTIIIAALFDRTGRTDTDAARMISKGCLEANPTIQPEEIARLIRTAQIPPNITNPVGLLIRALPSRCVPESIANYRERWQQEADQEKRRRDQELAQSVETARAILDGVAKGEEWDSSSVDWAKSILAGNGEGHAATG